MTPIELEVVTIEVQEQSLPASEASLDLRRRVERAILRVRPYLHVDGGDVELVRIDEQNMIVEVRLLGACQTCSLALMTLRAGVERVIMHEAPEIRRIESVR